VTKCDDDLHYLEAAKGTGLQVLCVLHISQLLQHLDACHNSSHSVATSSRVLKASGFIFARTGSMIMRVVHDQNSHGPFHDPFANWWMAENPRLSSILVFGQVPTLSMARKTLPASDFSETTQRLQHQFHLSAS
jgi:hypothetical protein